MSSVGWPVLQILVALIVMVMTGSVLVEIAFGINCWSVLEAWRLESDRRPVEPHLHRLPVQCVPTVAGRKHGDLTHSRRHVP